MAIKICLDAGHYGKYNRSPAVNDYYESEMNWELHLLLKTELESYGFEVITTRKDQAKDMTLSARGKASKGCDLFLSIHSNAVGSAVNEKVDYVVVYVPLNGTGDAIGEKLAKCVENVMGTQQEARVKTREGKNGDYYGVIRGAVSVGVPGLIIEHSFHTNTRSTNWLLEYDNLKKLAKAEAKVIAEHYGMAKKSDAVTETVKPAETIKWYRIRKSWNDVKSQKGAYKSLELAKDACPAGFTVYDWEGNAVYAPFASYRVKIIVDELNVRSGAGTSYKINTTVRKGSVFTIVAENGTWGKLKSGAGWMNCHPKYVKKL